MGARACVYGTPRERGALRDFARQQDRPCAKRRPRAAPGTASPNPVVAGSSRVWLRSRRREPPVKATDAAYGPAPSFLEYVETPRAFECARVEETPKREGSRRRVGQGACHRSLCPVATPRSAAACAFRRASLRTAVRAHVVQAASRASPRPYAPRAPRRARPTHGTARRTNPQIAAGHGMPTSGK